MSRYKFNEDNLRFQILPNKGGRLWQWASGAGASAFTVEAAWLEDGRVLIASEGELVVNALGAKFAKDNNLNPHSLTEGKRYSVRFLDSISRDDDFDVNRLDREKHFDRKVYKGSEVTMPNVRWCDYKTQSFDKPAPYGALVELIEQLKEKGYER